MDLQSSLKSYDNSLKKQETQYSGILGLTIDGSRKVNIPSRAGFVYVRLRDNLSEVVQAYNDKVSPAYGLPVIIQRTGNRWMVVGKDTNRYETWGTSAPFLPAHGSQHSFNRDVGVGGDTVWVYPDQFMPLLVYPSGTAGSTNLMVAPYLLKRDTDFIYAGNTGTQNLVMYKPADSQAILGLVVLNIDTGNPEILIASGTPISASLTGTSAIAPYIPYPASHQEPLYAFRLVSGTSYLTWDNLYNARQFIGGSSITSTGTSGGGNPAGNDRDVQFNNAGAFGADDQFIYQSDVKALGLGDYDLMPYDTTKLIWNVGDNVSPGIFGLAYGSTRAPYLGFAKADGTGTVPTNVKANQAIGRIRGYGYDGASWSGVQAEITIVASADWVTGSYLPTRFDFDVTPSGSATKRTQFQIHGDSVSIPTGSTYNVGGVPHSHTNLIPTDGWIEISLGSPTRTGNTTFTTTTNLTSLWQKGFKVKYLDTTVKFGYVVALSAYSSGSMTVTLAGDTLVGNPSAFYYSGIENPLGFPPYFDTATITFDVTRIDNGSGSAITSTVSRFSIVGTKCTHFIKGPTGYKVGSNIFYARWPRPSPMPTPIAHGVGSGAFGLSNILVIVTDFGATNTDLYAAATASIADNTQTNGFSLSYDYLF